MQLDVPSRFNGPPGMGHGGYVAGLLAERTAGAVQVTLRRPVPLDTAMDLDDLGDGRLALRHGDELVAESEPTTLALDVPAPPTPDDAVAAEAGSPSHAPPSGVHPNCFGCGKRPAEGDGLRIFAGPLEAGGTAQVAAVWRPGPAFAGDDGTVPTRWVLAALDCPGAFAFMVGGVRAGLLGRIAFEQHHDVAAGVDHVVTGWRIGEEGRKLFAGTALSAPDGRLLAAARATWFPMTAPA